VVAFYEALGVDAEAWFHKAAGPDLSYPVAFLASLPSGTMVERLDGAGGLLNRLSFEFGPEKLPVTCSPEVSLELPKRRRRSSFHRIVTAVSSAVRGTALVLRPPADADGPSLQPEG
jgi:hypothetical protein